MSLKSATISNIKWSFVEAISMKAISFVLSIVLARLLMPEDFGLLAIVNVFYLLVTLFIDGGLKEALIQKKDANETDFSSVFWLNLFMGLFLYGLLFFLAPFIESFYKYENLSFLIRLQSLTLIIESLGIVQIAKATKELNLKKITKARIPASLTSFCIGIFFAYHGYGVFSLIVQQLANTTLYILFLFISVRYRPRLVLNRQAVLPLYRFGLKILGMSLISRFYTQSLNLIYAKFYTPALLGLNNKANSLQTAPIEIINSTFMRGIYPTMVLLQGNESKLREVYLTNIKLLTYFMILINGLFFFKAEEIVEVLLGDNWMGSVVYLKIITIGSIFQPVAVQSQNIFKVRNLLSGFLKLELINKIATLLIIVVMVGIKVSFPLLLGVVIGINMFFSFVYLHVISKDLHFSFFNELLNILLRVILLGLVGLFIDKFIQYEFKVDNIAFRLGLFFLFYTIIVVVSFIVWDKEIFKRIKSILTSIIQQKGI